jgi:hypothetical protein
MRKINGISVVKFIKINKFIQSGRDRLLFCLKIDFADSLLISNIFFMLCLLREGVETHSKFILFLANTQTQNNIFLFKFQTFTKFQKNS